MFAYFWQIGCKIGWHCKLVVLLKKVWLSCLLAENQEWTFWSIMAGSFKERIVGNIGNACLLTVIRVGDLICDFNGGDITFWGCLLSVGECC